MDTLILEIYSSLHLLLSFMVMYIALFQIFRTKDIKKDCWIVSFVNAIFSTFIGLIEILHMYNIISFRIGYLQSYLLFVAYLLSDLLIGTIYYKSKLTFLFGYVHHILYIMIMSYMYSINMYHITNLSMVEELSVVVLSLGIFNSTLRNDLLYGVITFIVRILYHISMYIYFLYWYTPFCDNMTVWIMNIIMVSTTLLNFTMFSGWVKQYVVKYRFRN